MFKKFMVVIFLIALLFSLGCSASKPQKVIELDIPQEEKSPKNEEAPADKGVNARSTQTGLSDGKAEESEGWEWRSYIALLTPAVFGYADNYLGDFVLHSLGLRYGDIILTSAKNTAVEDVIQRARDEGVAEAVAEGNAKVEVISIVGFAPYFDYELLEFLPLDFPEDFPKNFQDSVSAFIDGSQDNADIREFGDYREEIEVLDDVYLIGQIRVGNKFYLVRRPARITAISPDKHSFIIQGSLSFHGMGGVVFWDNKKGREVPVGVVVDRKWDSEAIVFSIPSLIEVLKNTEKADEAEAK